MVIDNNATIQRINHKGLLRTKTEYYIIIQGGRRQPKVYRAISYKVDKVSDGYLLHIQEKPTTSIGATSRGTISTRAHIPKKKEFLVNDIIYAEDVDE